MSDTDKTQQKLVDSMRKTKEVGTTAAAKQAAEEKKTPPAKKKAARPKTAAARKAPAKKAVDKILPEAGRYSSGRRVWPD